MINEIMEVHGMSCGHCVNSIEASVGESDTKSVTFNINFFLFVRQYKFTNVNVLS